MGVLYLVDESVGPGRRYLSERQLKRGLGGLHGGYFTKKKIREGRENMKSIKRAKG
jgi:hypothetical protein